MDQDKREDVRDVDLHGQIQDVVRIDENDKEVPVPGIREPRGEAADLGALAAAAEPGEQLADRRLRQLDPTGERFVQFAPWTPRWSMSTFRSSSGKRGSSGLQRL
jgi:hypothetical protein